MIDKFKLFRIVFGMIIVGTLFCTALMGAYDLWIHPVSLVDYQAERVISDLRRLHSKPLI